MNPYFAKSPKLIQKLFSDYIWRKDSVNKEVYLTFDDGPHPKITEWVLNLLKKHNATATFFCVGDNVLKYPKIFNELIQQNHSIGNHTFDHLNGWKSSNEDYLNSVLKAEEIISKQKREERTDLSAGLAGKRKFESNPKTKNQQPTTKLFRPPYGKIKTSQAKLLIKKAYQIVMWDVLSADFDQNISKEKCLQNVIKNTKTGSIIVFHDSEKALKNLEYTLPKVLKYFSEKGFEFKAL